MSTLYDRALAVQRSSRITDSLEFDLYDVNDTVHYRHTVRLPLEHGTAGYGNEVVVVSRDTTVHLYRVQPPGEGNSFPHLST